MGRHKKPTALKEVQGTAHRNKNRLNPDEPKANGDIGSPPDYFNIHQIKIWNEFLDKSHKGVIGAADSMSLEIMTSLMYRFRFSQTDPDNVPGLMAAELSRLTGLLAQFGMTPADRAKISAPSKKKENPFAALKTK